MSLNFHHLRYFWAAARAGSITEAAKTLHVSQPTVSAQIRQLEESLGQRLFSREGRHLSLTPEGSIVFEYAADIFRLGEELQDTLAGSLTQRPARLIVGLAGTIPNLVSFHLLEAAFGLPEPVRIVVRENRTDQLLAGLATHEVDLVLADMPIPANVGVRAYEHALGSSPIDIFGPPLLAHRVREGFPTSLDGQPFLLPAEGYMMRRSLDAWFDNVGVRPRVFAEIEDIDLVNVFAEAGAGFFAAPAIIADDLRVRYAVERVGRAQGAREDFYAITAERRIAHPAIVAIMDGARQELASGRAQIDDPT